MGDHLSSLIAILPAPFGALTARPDAKAERISAAAARALFESGDVLVCHAHFVAGRLGAKQGTCVFDVLELFAFIRPATPLVPSPLGLARALGLELPQCADDCVYLLHLGARALLEELASWPKNRSAELAPLVGSLGRAGWRWAPLLEPITGQAPHGSSIGGLEAWRRLRAWEDESALAETGSQTVDPVEARTRLEAMVGTLRPEQGAYSDAACYAFAPCQDETDARIILAEAGTGTGKTLGYLAPASLWAQKNGPGLWISTYTRNLQRQIIQELSYLWPDPEERAQKAVLRKGRENYLCLLNFEDAARRAALLGGQRTIALGLIARWIGACGDGDLSGAGFPAFLAASLPLSIVTDRRGECIYSACPHYRTCFIERAVRRARHADIVIANHALVIAQAQKHWLESDQTTDAGDERRLRYVFDEGHHIFDAADSGFSAKLSGRQMRELRRWIRGPEGQTHSRMRGLHERLKDLIGEDRSAQNRLDDVLQAAGMLAAEGWLSRLASAPRGLGERFLAEIYAHVQTRSTNSHDFYTLQAEPWGMNENLLALIGDVKCALRQICDPLLALARHLRRKIDAEPHTEDANSKARLVGAARGLEHRAKVLLPVWMAMLETLETGEIPADFVDWFEITREEGRDLDVGLERHWIDPTVPFAAEILGRAQGALITSATLRDDRGAADDDWTSAEIRTGVSHLPVPAKRAHFGSPFRYDQQARIFIVKDVVRGNAHALADAYRALFLASGGGALGLFTAVRTLRETAKHIGEPLAAAGLSLYAQHIDHLDTGALVDLFRAEENACLLGTDALRDGVDVPGRSLRLVVFDKVPWPKPTILHKARRARFGKGYDDLITRFRLKQAFGRLIRGPQDRGCFVILEGAMPSRLLSAFPEQAPVSRCSLAQAIGEIQSFLGPAFTRHAPLCGVDG